VSDCCLTQGRIKANVCPKHRSTLVPLHINFNPASAIFSAISCREQVNCQWDDVEVRFVLDQHVVIVNRFRDIYEEPKGTKAQFFLKSFNVFFAWLDFFLIFYLLVTFAGQYTLLFNFDISKASIKVILCLRSEFRVVMSVTISALKRCSVRLYLQLVVWGCMSYLRYLCLFT